MLLLPLALLAAPQVVTFPPLPEEELAAPATPHRQTPAAKLVVVEDPARFLELLQLEKPRDLRRVDFEEVQGIGAEPFLIRPDRYAESDGLILRGEGGQYLHTDFRFPADFTAGDSRVQFAPGPIAPPRTHGWRGGSRTEASFVHAGQSARVAGFGAVFIDADHPDRAPCRIAAYDAEGELLGEATGFSGASGSRLFRGLVALDGCGQPTAVIARVELVSGDEWPWVDVSEGVALDDFRFPPPVSGEQWRPTWFAGGEEREQAIEAEVAAYEGAHPWAGQYYHGDGTGVNVTLKLAPDNGFHFTWRGCLGEYDRNYGRLTVDEAGVIHLHCERPNVRKGFRGIDELLVPVAWAGRRYLIPPDELDEFLNQRGGRWEPRDSVWGFHLLRWGDEEKPADGAPQRILE